MQKVVHSEFQSLSGFTTTFFLCSRHASRAVQHNESKKPLQGSAVTHKNVVENMLQNLLENCVANFLENTTVKEF